MMNTTEINQFKLSSPVLLPLPDFDFDPTEAAIPWKAIISNGWKVIFSTENGNIAQGDTNKLKGPLPGFLSASAKAQAAYQEMTRHPSYQKPIPYGEINPDLFIAVFLPGGDGPRMRQYLDNAVLRTKVWEFWRHGKLVGAICHGVLVLARTQDPQTGRSILYGRKVTAIPRSLDQAAYYLDQWFTRRGYVMYPKCVADEVRGCLEQAGDLSFGSGILTPYVVTDGNLITSRWYMDAEIFGEHFAKALEQRIQAT